MGNGVEAASAKSKARQLPAPDVDNQSQQGSNCNKVALTGDDSPLSRFHAALLELVAAPPADFQAAFAAVAQAAIAEGVRDVPAPRSIKELATWFDLWRKAAGLDAKAGPQGNAPLVNPLRTVSRRAGAVVDVEPVDVAPVPGSEGWEAWEV